MIEVKKKFYTIKIAIGFEIMEPITDLKFHLFTKGLEIKCCFTYM